MFAKIRKTNLVLKIAQFMFQKQKEQFHTPFLKDEIVFNLQLVVTYLVSFNAELLRLCLQ